MFRISLEIYQKISNRSHQKPLENQSRHEIIKRGNMKTKKEIRKAVLAERRALDEETISLASQVICRKIMEIIEYKEAENLCLYMPINNEVNVMLLAEVAVEEGKKVWTPKVIEKGAKDSAGKMVFNRYLGSDKDEILTGAYDIMESKSEEILEVNDRTLIIMPGAVFTPWRERIGYGGGFYDRFLDENPQCHTIAACYDLQVLMELPVEDFDKKPDYVVSETSIYR